MKVAFLVNDLQLSGGVGVVVQHAHQLSQRHGFDVTLVLVREWDLPNWDYGGLPHLHVASLAEARRERFDLAVATWWETTFSLFKLRARRHVYFLQSLEDRFYAYGEADRMGAALTLGLPVAFVTEARWIADFLARARPDARCMFVRNGLDKNTFRSPERIEPRLDGPLRILIEGNPRVWFKGVARACAAAAGMAEAGHVTVVTADHEALGNLPRDRTLGPVNHAEMARLYAESDVVLKLSSVEGMYLPPLEGFHMGATTVTTPVTGHEEYVVHGWNGLVCDWDDLRGTARLLDLLARDRELLHFLRSNALATARGWPSWEQSGAMMSVALRRIAELPPPPPRLGADRMLGDVRAEIEVQRFLLHERKELQRTLDPIHRLQRNPAVATLIKARHDPRVKKAARPLRPVYRRVRKRLLGR